MLMIAVVVDSYNWETFLGCCMSVVSYKVHNKRSMSSFIVYSLKGKMGYTQKMSAKIYYSLQFLNRFVGMSLGKLKRHGPEIDRKRIQFLTSSGDEEIKLFNPYM